MLMIINILDDQSEINGIYTYVHLIPETNPNITRQILQHQGASQTCACMAIRLRAWKLISYGIMNILKITK